MEQVPLFSRLQTVPLGQAQHNYKVCVLLVKKNLLIKATTDIRLTRMWRLGFRLTKAVEE